MRPRWYSSGAVVRLEVLMSTGAPARTYACSKKNPTRKFLAGLRHFKTVPASQWMQFSISSAGWRHARQVSIVIARVHNASWNTISGYQLSPMFTTSRQQRMLRGNGRWYRAARHLVPAVRRKQRLVRRRRRRSVTGCRREVIAVERMLLEVSGTERCAR